MNTLVMLRMIVDAGCGTLPMPVLPKVADVLLWPEPLPPAVAVGDP